MHQHSQRPNLQSNDHELYDVIELVAITMMSLRLSPARVLCSGRHREGAVREGPCSEVAAMHREGEVEVFDSDDTFGKGVCSWIISCISPTAHTHHLHSLCLTKSCFSSADGTTNSLVLYYLLCPTSIMQCQTPLAQQLVTSEEDTSLLSAQCGASALHCFLAKPPGSMKIDVLGLRPHFIMIAI